MRGKGMLLENFNVRTSNKGDFIANNIINFNILNEVTEWLTNEIYITKIVNAYAKNYCLCLNQAVQES